MRVQSYYTGAKLGVQLLIMVMFLPFFIPHQSFNLFLWIFFFVLFCFRKEEPEPGG